MSNYMCSTYKNINDLSMVHCSCVLLRNFSTLYIQCMQLYRSGHVRLTKTHYTLTHGRINSCLSLVAISQLLRIYMSISQQVSYATYHFFITSWEARTLLEHELHICKTRVCCQIRVCCNKNFLYEKMLKEKLANKICSLKMTLNFFKMLHN